MPLDSVREQVEACVEVAARAGLDFLVVDQTRPDVGVPVVRVLAPGLRHFYKRFAPGRLYDVPVRMGLLDKPLSEGEVDALPAAHLRHFFARAGKKAKRKASAALAVSARINAQVHLQAQPDGNVTASFDDFSLPLGKYSIDALKRAQGIGAGLPLASFSSRKLVDQEIALLVQRLARMGLIEYRFGTREQRPRDHRAADRRILAASCEVRRLPTPSCCRALLICAAAATTWCWNRRARRAVPD